MMMMMMMIYSSHLLGHAYILQRKENGDYELIRTIRAHNRQVDSVALNNKASILATVCYDEGEVKLWDVKHGASTSVVDIHMLTHTGTLIQGMPFVFPESAIFLSRSSTKLIVACENSISAFDLSTRSTKPFGNIPQGAWYRPNALALTHDDALLVAGNYWAPYSVCVYDTSSLTRLWILETALSVGAVCILGAHVLVTVDSKPSFILECKTGARIAALQKAEGSIIGLGVIEGLCFILS
jgi:WD40 repeat protein